MKESQHILEIAVGLATSLVVAPYLLIHNYYHRNVAQIEFQMEEIQRYL